MVQVMYNNPKTDMLKASDTAVPVEACRAASRLWGVGKCGRLMKQTKQKKPKGVNMELYEQKKKPKFGVKIFKIFKIYT